MGVCASDDADARTGEGCFYVTRPCWPFERPRAMLRVITNYITDNALHPIALADVRSAWAGVMAAPTRLIALPNGKIT